MRALRDPELAEHVGADRPRPRVVAPEQLERRRQRRLVAAPGQRGQVRRPLGVGVPLAHRGLHQLVERVRRQPRVEPEVGQRRVGPPAQPVGRAHRPRAGRLDLGQLERAAVAVEQQPVAIGAHVAAGRRQRLAVDLGTDHAQVRPAGERQPRADVGPQRAHHPLDLLGRARRVERAIDRLDLVCVGDAALVLLRVRWPLIQRPHQRLPADARRAGPRATRSRRRPGSARAPRGRPARSRGPR